MRIPLYRLVILVLGIDEYDGNNLRRMNTLTEGGNKWLSNALDSSYKSCLRIP